jgi:hypothetical protein
MRNLVYCRKPGEWSVVDGRYTVRASELPAGLPEVEVLTQPGQDFVTEMPALFIAVVPNVGRFLVRTEGSNYARYALRIVEVARA